MDYKDYTFSKSSMLALLKCPKQFELGYIKKVKGETNKYAIKGIKIHSLLEKINKNQMCIEEVPWNFKTHVDNYLKFLDTNKLDLPVISEGKRLSAEFEGIKFDGRLDAVFVKGDVGFVLDYKTGKEKVSLADHRFELQLYSYLTEKNLNIKVHKYGILFTANGLFLQEVNDRRYDELKRRILEMKHIFEQKEMNAKYMYQTCKLCFFKRHCDIYKKNGG